jgi:hypothetical protein
LGSSRDYFNIVPAAVSPGIYVRTRLVIGILLAHAAFRRGLKLTGFEPRSNTGQSKSSDHKAQGEKTEFMGI